MKLNFSSLFLLLFVAFAMISGCSTVKSKNETEYLTGLSGESKSLSVYMSNIYNDNSEIVLYEAETGLYVVFYASPYSTGTGRLLDLKTGEMKIFLGQKATKAEQKNTLKTI